MQYLKNETLPTIRNNWKGNPIKGNEFQYTDRNYRPEWSVVFKMLFTPNPQRKEKRNDQWRPALYTDTSYLTNKNKDCIIWLGHATFLIQLGGIRLITDPVLYSLPLLTRKVQIPFDPSLLKDIDYLLLSHDHRDHCDEKSFKKLLSNNNPTILTSLRMSNILSSWIGKTSFQEAGWYQQYQTKASTLTITYLPAQHWCRRGLTDFNLRLWGSFMIEYKGLKIYFGADSASGSHFREIGQLFPDIDIAILGIGAYKPEFLMKDNHTSPKEAYEAYQQLGAKRMIPMHYGTYDLSNEPISEPYHLIQDCFRKDNKEQDLCLLGVNELLRL